MNETRTLAEWNAQTSTSQRIQNLIRSTAIRGLAVGKRIERSTNWIRFPFYHHVFEDEQQNFSNQLNYLRNIGEFISLDDALLLISGNQAVDGRYFCLTFDDGLKNCVNVALPILLKLEIPAVFYIVTGMVAKSFDANDPIARNVFGFKGQDTTLDFLSWADCSKMVEAGMTIGSHTVTHTRLSDLTEDQAFAELSNSKNEIQQKTGKTCDHFCAPYGNPNTDFDLAFHSNLAKSAGYKTFVTGQRGPTRSGDNPLAIKRDHMMANWGIYQLRYFLTLD